jgi:hypothetical protein
MSRDIGAILDPLLWSGIEEVDVGGAMRKHASFAKAIWVNGAVLAFIKCLWPADSTATARARQLSNPNRLRRMHERLAIAKESNLPLVPLLHLEQHPSGALVIGMLRVTPVRDIIINGKAGVALALKILRRLGPPSTQELHWYHTDICPRNIGVDEQGNVWLIDLDSLYIKTEGVRNAAPEVSVLASKPPRQPRRIRTCVEQKMSDPRVHRQQHAFETMLVAAECSLGLIDPGIVSPSPVGDESPDRWIVPWLDSKQSQYPGLASFWREWLLKGALIGVESTLEVASDLEALEQSTVPTPFQVPMSEPVLAPPDAVDMTALRRRLRRDDLSRGEMISYEQSLAQELRKDPNPATYHEIIFLALCYLKDSELARNHADEAHAKFPEDERLRGIRRLLHITAVGKSK